MILGDWSRRACGNMMSASVAFCTWKPLIGNVCSCPRQREFLDAAFCRQAHNTFLTHTWYVVATTNPQDAGQWQKGEAVLANLDEINASDMRHLITISDTGKCLVPAHTCPAPGDLVALNCNNLERTRKEYEASLKTGCTPSTTAKLLELIRYTALGAVAAKEPIPVRGGQRHGTADDDSADLRDPVDDDRPWAEVLQRRSGLTVLGHKEVETELLTSSVTSEVRQRRIFRESVLSDAYHTALHLSAAAANN